MVVDPGRKVISSVVKARLGTGNLSKSLATTREAQNIQDLHDRPLKLIVKIQESRLNKLFFSGWQLAQYCYNWCLREITVESKITKEPGKL